MDSTRTVKIIEKRNFFHIRCVNQKPSETQHFAVSGFCMKLGFTVFLSLWGLILDLMVFGAHTSAFSVSFNPTYGMTFELYLILKINRRKLGRDIRSLVEKVNLKSKPLLFNRKEKYKNGKITH